MSFFSCVVRQKKKIDKNKNKMENELEKKQDVCQCPECQKREAEHQAAEEFGLAVLIALMPIMTLTLFGNIGLL